MTGIYDCELAQSTRFVFGVSGSMVCLCLSIGGLHYVLLFPLRFVCGSFWIDKPEVKATYCKLWIVYFATPTGSVEFSSFGSSLVTKMGEAYLPPSGPPPVECSSRCQPRHAAHTA